VDARLTIARESASDVKQRQVIIKLDGDPFAVLLFGDTVTRSIDPGAHRLSFDNTWAKKKIDFAAADGEQVNYSVINRAGRLTWWMVAALGAGPMYLTIERQATEPPPATSNS